LFIRYHELMKEREQGFTLIELLVVILIIAILAAIAIPVFLTQRKKGWKAQVESTLKNMATSEESYLTSNTAYTSSLTNLAAEGFKYAASEIDAATLQAVAVGATNYCLYAQSAHESAISGIYDSSSGRPVVKTDGSLTAPSSPCV
jgi:type IV pilus assembly protein PilA